MENYKFDWAKEQERDAEENQKHLRFVKQNIDFNFNLLLEQLNDMESWRHQGFVEVEKTDYKASGYRSYDFYLQKGEKDKRYYMRQDDEGNYHNMVWQTVGILGDDFSGYLLVPLKDGRYWKIFYTC